ncbi:MAG: asparagine synthase-related protein [bacterium]
MVTKKFKEHYNLIERLEKRSLETKFTNPEAQCAYEQLMFLDQWHVKDSSLLISRAPFLDRRLVEFCLNLPGWLKHNGRDTKIIHRCAMKNVLPQIIIDRKSKSDLGDSIRLGVNKEWSYIESKFNTFRLEKHNILKEGTIETLLRKMKSGVISQTVPALRILSLEFWLQSIGW